MSNNDIKFAEKIRLQYEEKETSTIDELKELDRRVKKPADAFAYTFGTIGSLVLGTGMCLTMPEVIEGYMPLGIGVGLVGILMVSINYLLHKSILNSRKAKYAPKILELSNKILNT